MHVKLEARRPETVEQCAARDGDVAAAEHARQVVYLRLIFVEPDVAFNIGGRQTLVANQHGDGSIQERSRAVDARLLERTCDAHVGLSRAGEKNVGRDAFQKAQV